MLKNLVVGGQLIDGCPARFQLEEVAINSLVRDVQKSLKSLRQLHTYSDSRIWSFVSTPPICCLYDVRELGTNMFWMFHPCSCIAQSYGWRDLSWLQ